LQRQQIFSQNSKTEAEMARAKHSNPFVNRTNRLKQLAANKEHWTPADEGISLGYRRGKYKSVWYVRRYCGNGKYEQRPLGLADDYQDADGADILTYYQAQNRAKEREDRERPLPSRSGYYTVADAVRDYLEGYKATSGKQTREVERVFNRDIIPALGKEPVEQLTRAKLIGWRNGLIRQKPRNRAGDVIELDIPEAEQTRRRKATAQRKWTMLRAALNHAFHNGHVVSDAAWRSVEPLKGIDAPPPTRVLTVKECRLVSKKLDEHFRPIAEATFLTGAAFKELRETVVADYIPESGHLRVFNTKRRPRLVPLTEEGQELFDRLTAGKEADALIFTDADGNPWQKNAQARRMKDASKAAKMKPPVTLTDLRDAYGSLLLNAGVSLEVVSKAMGHASTATTAKHYAHLLQGTVDKAIRDALPKLGVSKSNVRRMP
jgi:integrase